MSDRAWLINTESRAKLEVMAKKKKQTARQKNGSEPSSGTDLCAQEALEEPSEQKVSVLGEDPYEQELDFLKLTTFQESACQPSSSLPPVQHKRFSTIQKVLVASIILIAAIFVYGLLTSRSAPAPALVRVPTDHRTPVADQISAADATQQAPPQANESEAAFSPGEALSLKVARDLYLQKDFHKAYAAYDQLCKTLPADQEQESLRDFLQLRMASCMKNVGHVEEADGLVRAVLRSRFPAVRTVASYRQSLSELQRKRYLNVRTRAYQTIALIDAADYDEDWALSWKRDCEFLIAESMTKNVISFCDADKDIPPQLWSSYRDIDYFANLSEMQLRFLLNSGSALLSKVLLGPQVQKVQHGGTAPAWLVMCYGAPIDELLARFAANAEFDIHWASESASGSEGTRAAVRKRPVTLYMSTVTPQQVVTVAAGCAGLLARMDDNKTVKIFNPSDYSSLSQQMALLGQEAVSLWQRFVLTCGDDKRTANAHFALGLLQAQRDHITDAIAEYKLVANRFSQASLAPYAMLHSSKLKVKLRDYSGARDDLKQLIEQYPDADFSDRACLYLADATMKSGLLNEASRLYRKVYNLGWSLESQTASALGAGRCFYQTKGYEEAAKWLTRYITLARDQRCEDLYSAYCLLGKTNLTLGKYQVACDALEHAITGPLPRVELVEALSALVNAHTKQGNFVEALSTLDNTDSWQLPQKESLEILLLKASVLRSMGLVDKAITTLGDRVQYLPDPQLKAKLSFELAKCSIAKGDLELARRSLTEILVIAEPGALAHEVGCELADVCLQLGQNSQTISICSQLLDSTPATSIKQRALNLLATAYKKQKNYDRAALAFLGQPNATKNRKDIFTNTTARDPTSPDEVSQ